MPAHRATILLSAAVASLTLTALPASAQVPDGVVLNIMRECAKIGDPTARLACYDNNIRQAGATPSTGQVVPQQSRSPGSPPRSEEHTSELQSRENLVCRLLLEKKNRQSNYSRVTR